MRRELPPEVTQLLRSRRGVATLDHLFGVIAPAELRALVRAGLLARVVRGVYAAGAAPIDARVRLRALESVYPHRFAGCLETAAEVLGFGVIASPELHVLPRERRGPMRRADVRVHEMSVAPRDLVVEDGLVVTSPARTAADLARLLSPMDAVATLDVAMAIGETDADAVARVLGRMRGARGVVRARRVLAMTDPLAESPMESRLRWRILEGGLPRPVSQYPVYVGRAISPRYRLDLAWPDHRLGVEYDGAGHLGRAAQRADLDRRNDLHELGWLIYGCTDVHVYREHDAMVRLLARELARRAPGA